MANGVANPAQAAVDIALSQGVRYPQITIYRPRATVTVPGGAPTVDVVVVEQEFDQGQHGFLTAIGHEASNVGWANFNWRINVKGASARGFGFQKGLQWGRVAAPGEAFVWVPEGKTIQLLVRSDAATAEPATGLLVGYWWPSGRPTRNGGK